MTFTRKHLGYLLTVPVVIAAAWMILAKPEPKARRKQQFFELTATGKRSNRPVYPFSVVPGGIYDRDEASRAVKLDPVVAKHYSAQGVDVDNLRAVTTTKTKQGYVSYRVGDRIYWTKKKVEIEPGEVVLTDGVHKIRGRCGNMISDKPHSPVLNVEPPAKQMNEPDPALKPSIDPSADGAVPGPVMPKLALERDTDPAGTIHAYVAGLGSGSNSNSSGSGGAGAGGFGGSSSGAGGSGSGGGRSGSGGASGGGGGGAVGGAAGGGGNAGAGTANGLADSGSNGATAKGAAYAIAAADTISGFDKFGAQMTLKETASGANSGSSLSGMVSSLFGTPNPNASGGGLGAGQDGSNLLASGPSGVGGLSALSLAGGPADVKILASNGAQPGSGAGKGPVHPFSADANAAAQLPPGNPSENMGRSTQLGGGNDGHSTSGTGSSSSKNSDTLAKRRDNARPDGASGTPGSGEEPFSVRPTAEVPEPSTYLMIGAGLTILALRRKRPASR